MGAFLHDIAVAQDEDDIGIANRAQTMRNHEARTSFHKGIHGALDEFLSTRVDV